MSDKNLKPELSEHQPALTLLFDKLEEWEDILCENICPDLYENFGKDTYWEDLPELTLVLSYQYFTGLYEYSVYDTYDKYEKPHKFFGEQIIGHVKMKDFYEDMPDFKIWAGIRLEPQIKDFQAIFEKVKSIQLEDKVKILLHKKVGQS